MPTHPADHANIIADITSVLADTRGRLITAEQTIRSLSAHLRATSSALEAAITAAGHLEDRVAALEHARGALPAACADRTCTYYSHYLGYGQPGEPNLEHDAYHSAEALCSQAQDAVTAHYKTHTDSNPPGTPSCHACWAAERRAQDLEFKIRC